MYATFPVSKVIIHYNIPMKKLPLMAALMLLLGACSPWFLAESTLQPPADPTTLPIETLAPTASRTPRPTIQPSATFVPSPSEPVPTEFKGRSYFDPELDMDCIFWDSITPEMEGQQVCVYGKVSSTLLQFSGWYVYFKDDGRSFYLIILKEGNQFFYFPSIEQGLCVRAVGEIKTYADIPRIEITTIYYWQASNYYCEKQPEV